MAKDSEVIIIDFATRRRQSIKQDPTKEESLTGPIHTSDTRIGLTGGYWYEDNNYKNGRLVSGSGGHFELRDESRDLSDLSPIMQALRAIAALKPKP